ncbi:protein rep, partial [Kribbella sandramycini]|uniref:protein rep n=1 Tax=Kribbella sandramycini TaxID=60450 RepID=UPI0031DFDF67
YNPHFHVLFCVPASYFKKKELYIKQEKWTALWKRAMKLDYDPIVNVKAVKGKEKIDKENIEQQQESMKNAVIEVSKYPVK